MKIKLDGTWKLDIQNLHGLVSKFPCSVIDTLLENKIIDDPYLFGNEEKSRVWLENNAVFSKEFNLTKEQLGQTNYLVCLGLDTVCNIFINGKNVLYANDMHRTFRVLLTSDILKENNQIKVEFTSPYNYTRSFNNDNGVYETFAVTEPKSPVLRKANYMFGWDWGINLADMGIFRDIYIESTNVGFIKDYRVYTKIDSNEAKVKVEVSSEKLSQAQLKCYLNYGEQTIACDVQDFSKVNEFVFNITNPKLWYPSGLGRQELYDLTLCIESDKEKYLQTHKIGLREIKIDDNYDETGRNFALYVNDEKVFLKGSNYIPEDCILSRYSKERTEKLLKLCKDFNHNMIRVWAGGLYPDDYFYECCDRMGLLVWQDLMFACAAYDISDEDFKQNIIAETQDNLRRIRNHPSLFIIAGNNEIEDGIRGHGYLKAVHYVEMFEKILRGVVNSETNLYYLPSSPTSGNPIFAMPQDMNYLDVHYWPDVSQKVDIEVYGKIEPRLLSEFGYQSYANYDTTKKYISESDLYVNSPQIKLHQKKPNNDDVMPYYVDKYYKTQQSFKEFIYLSQLVQANVIRWSVEHLRVNKPVTNGAIYWQLNDDWYTQSWSSIDYDFGIKALHYYSRRFFAPELIVVEKTNEGIKISISNDLSERRKYIVKYWYKDFDNNVLHSKEVSTELEKQSSKQVLNLNAFYDNRKDTYIKVELFDEKGKLLSENYLQQYSDKDIDYAEPSIDVEKIDKNTLKVTANTFVKNVYIEMHDNENMLSDNYFNLEKNVSKTITLNKDFSVKDIDILYTK